MSAMQGSCMRWTSLWAITLPVHSSQSNLRIAAVYVLCIEWASAGQVGGVSYPPIHQQNPGSALQRCLLFVTPSQTATHCDHPFVFCSAVIWNNLSSTPMIATSIQVYKALLKSDLFHAYCQNCSGNSQGVFRIHRKQSVSYLTRLPPRDSTLDGRWTRKPIGLSRVQRIYLSIPRPS